MLTEPGARALVDALTAPATQRELAREAEFVAAFTALHGDLREQIFDRPAQQAVAAAAVVPFHRGRSGGRRRWRLAALGGIAAVAVTGTAAALTGTLPLTHPEPPATSQGPLPSGPRSGSGPGGATSTGSASTGPDGTRTGSPAPGTSAPGASGGPTGVPGGTGASGAQTGGTTGGTTGGQSGGATGGTTGGTTGPTTTPGSPTPSPSTSTPSTSTPGPSPSTGGTAPLGELRAACKKFVKGNLKPGSHQYEILVAAAGGIAKVPAFCASIGVGTSQNDQGDQNPAG